VTGRPRQCLADQRTRVGKTAGARPSCHQMLMLTHRNVRTAMTAMPPRTGCGRMA
jgi:hypothetical protein